MGPWRFHDGARRPDQPAPRTGGCAVRLCGRRNPQRGVCFHSPPGAFSLNLLFDRAIEAGRLYGLRLEGVWMHVGTPEAIAAAEAAIVASVA